MRRLGLLVSVLVACNEYSVVPPSPPPPAAPPGSQEDVFGSPPADWEDCYRGMEGLYFNLLPDHPDVESEEIPVLEDVDWWSDEYLAYRRYDASTDFGANWWPVEEGMPDDPRYFAVRWVGWLRVFRSGSQLAVLGASTDAWVLVDDAVVAQRVASEAFETDTFTLDMNTGVYRVDLRFAHRAGLESGFRFRFATEDVAVCAPTYD